MNLRLQGANTHMLETNEKIDAFCKKLELRSRNLRKKTKIV